MREYDNRFFYLMDETDIVTGRHLKRSQKQWRNFCEGLEKPSVVMICITTVWMHFSVQIWNVSAVKAEEKAGLPVRPYLLLYALTRGKKTADGACKTVFIFPS